MSHQPPIIKSFFTHAVIDGHNKDRGYIASRNYIKTNLCDVTCCIQVEIDSADRLQNLYLSVNSLLEHFNINVIVLETGSQQHIKALPEQCLYMFARRTSTQMSRNRWLNVMFNMAETPIVVTYDVDCIVSPSGFLEAVMKIRSGEFHFAFPYSGVALWLDNEMKQDYINHRLLPRLTSDVWGSDLMQKSHCHVGLAVIASKDHYLACGGENQNLEGWGMDDIERYMRFSILGYDFYQPNCCVYHLPHPRQIGVNDYYSEEKIQQNRRELEYITSMNFTQMKECIRSWPWNIWAEI